MSIYDERIESLSLYPHQKETLAKLVNGNVLLGGVGSGKTRVAVAYYLKNEAPKDVYVFTTARKRDELDWEKDFASVGIGKTKDSTLAGVLTVDSYNNLAKYADLKGAFIIADEQKLAGKGVWVKAFQKMAKHNNWILLSATPADNWMDLVPVFIANGFFKNRTEFSRDHCVFSYYGSFPKLERYLGEGKLTKLRNSIVVHMPYDRHTTRHLHTITVEYDKPLMDISIKRRWNPFTNKPMKDAAELYSVMRKVSNSDPSRLLEVHRLIKKHPKLIVFYQNNFELETLRSLESVVTVAEWNGFKHEPIPETDSWVYLVQYQAGAEAWNCVETDAMCFYSLTYSYRNFEQAQGRIDRLNTPYVDLHYYILRSKSFIDLAIWRALSMKKNFNEKTLTAKEKENYVS